MKPITVKVLKKLCEDQIKMGNGDKVIMISQDDEGNGYHYLWYSFSSIEQMEEPVVLGDKIYECPFEFIDENIATKDNTIILG